MNGDHMPIGGHRRQLDPKRIEEIKKGWKKADKIRKEADAKHKNEDVPAAEEQLLKDLEGLG